MNETVWWTPFNKVQEAHLKQRDNMLVLKLLKARDDFRFTLGLRSTKRRQSGKERGFNGEDWLVDLVDRL